MSVVRRFFSHAVVFVLGATAGVLLTEMEWLMASNTIVNYMRIAAAFDRETVQLEPCAVEGTSGEMPNTGARAASRDRGGRPASVAWIPCTNASDPEWPMYRWCFDATGTLRYNPAEAAGVFRRTWHGVARALAGKHLVMIGDSRTRYHGYTSSSPWRTLWWRASFRRATRAARSNARCRTRACLCTTARSLTRADGPLRAALTGRVTSTGPQGFCAQAARLRCATATAGM
jgi:hypothetical protein